MSMDELQIGAANAIDKVSRAERVRRDLIALKQSVTISFFDIGELMVEARDNGYHMDWGYQNFGEWIQNNMDMSERQGYYLMRIVEGQRKLGLPRNALMDLSMSKLKSIFGLDFDKFEKDIKGLLMSAPDMTADEVEAAAQTIKGGGIAVSPLLWLTIKVSPEVKKLVKQAFEGVRQFTGRDLSDSQCLEYIIADFTAGNFNVNQEQTESSTLT